MIDIGMKSISSVIFIGIFLFTFVFRLPSVYASDIVRAATQSASMNVTAKVLPRPQDFQLILSSDAVQSTVGADQEITYTITYGSYLKYPTPMTITINWGLGTTKDQALTQYDIVSYVAGSATKDYWGGSTPVVNITNRTITWTTPSFPNYTIDKTLSFRLKTPGRYVTDQNVDFTVAAKMKTEDFTGPETSLTLTYAPREFIAHQVAGLHIVSMDIRSITDTSFSLYLVTSVPTKATLYYGTTLDLDETKTDNTLSDQKIFTIDGLQPATKYYFRIMVENAAGIQRKTPEVFEVTTASRSLMSLIDQDRLYMTTHGVLLRNITGVRNSDTVLVPRAGEVDVALPFKVHVPSLVYLSIADRRVLGESTDKAPPQVRKIRLLETQPDTYTGSFTTPLISGTYDLMIETQSTSGAQNRDVLTVLQVTDPIRVQDATGKPIEKAVVYLEQYNSQSRRFEYFPAETFGASNPVFTDADGVINVTFPPGEYSINIHALGYQPHQSMFTLNNGGERKYPQITLVSQPFSIMNHLYYYGGIFLDGVNLVNHNLNVMTASYRYLDFSLIGAVGLLTLLSIALNLRRVKLSLEGLYIYIEKTVRRLTNWGKNRTLFIGFVENAENGFPVHAATVLLARQGERFAIARDVTSAFGEFHLHITPGVMYELVIKKHGFAPVRSLIDTNVLLEGHPPFGMRSETRIAWPWWVEFGTSLFRAFVHAVSDMLLFGLIFIDILLIWRLGIVRMAIIGLVTILNISLWVNYQWVAWQTKRRHVK
jgi:hypothetical protein